MRARLELLIALALCPASVAAPPIAAQVGTEVVPYAGLYIPTANMMNPAFPGVPPVTQHSTVSVGARVTRWLPSHVGVELTFGYSPSSVNPGATYDCCNAAHLFTGSVRAFAPVLVHGGRVMFRMGGGVGLVAHGGRAYANTTGATSIAGVGSAGVAFKLFPSSLTLRFDAEDYLFSPHLGAGPGCDRGGYTGICGQLLRAPAAFKAQVQNDIVLSVGLAVASGRQ